MKKIKIFLSFLIAFTLFIIPCGVLGADLQSSSDNTGRWVIKVDDNISSLSGSRSTVRSVETETQGALEPEVIGDSLYYVTEDYEAAKAMAESGIAEYVEETTYSTLSYVPNDTFYLPQPGNPHGSYQYSSDIINAEPAWDITQGSSNVRIVVIDSGFYYSHEDGANIKSGKDYVDGGENKKDRSRHGTATAGLIGATTNNSLGIAGAAPNCEVYMLRCFGNDNNSTIGDNMAIAEAIRDAVDIYHADIISMSFGGTYNAEYMYEAVQYAYSKGTIMVAATGNKGDSSYGIRRNQIEFPAAYDEVIGVSSVDWEKRSVESATKNKSTYVTAPGASVLSLSHHDNSSSTYAPDDGTSFAAPYVSALAGLAKSIDPDITPSEFMALLRYTSEDRGAAGYDYSYGYGIINYGALLGVIDQNKFLDVPDNDWYSDAVYGLQSLGIINGRSQYFFEPNSQIKRSEFVKILASSVNADVNAYSGTSVFSDVKSGDWFANHINWAAAVGIINGYGDGTVRPEANITREEMCSMLNRFIKNQGINLTDQGLSASFTDASSVSFWAEEDVYDLVSAGIIKGNEDNTFRPANNASRAEVCVMVDRLIDNYFD